MRGGSVRPLVAAERVRDPWVLGTRSSSDTFAAQSVQVAAMSQREDASVRMWQADSVVTLLAKLDVETLPAEEGQAVADCQASSVDAWIAAYATLRDMGALQPWTAGQPARNT